MDLGRGRKRGSGKSTVGVGELNEGRVRDRAALECQARKEKLLDFHSGGKKEGKKGSLKQKEGKKRTGHGGCLTSF